ncbi:MAG: Hsp20/alpha crystallin family protein, partial [Clostridia bacterium]|nr:Hsp20/alpha crystallin family protein [Clostridia bacterium]
GEGWLGGGWPSVDVYERGGDVVVEIELPGVDPENIRLEVNEDSVFVEAERREDKETQGEGLYRRVRRFGRVSRRIPLPTAVKADQARARYRNGLLEVTIPRAEGGGGRRVPIETD